MRLFLTALAGFCLMLAVACGGGSSATSGGGAGGGGGTGSVTTPTVVTVAGGQNVPGTNITVASPASSPTPNAQFLGVSTGVSGSASNTGGSLRQGETMTVLLFGPGLSGSMTISISGPPDIAISNQQSITATDNTPGVSFTAAAAMNAALGARTVILQDSKNDITAFTGGLEVAP